MLVSVIVPMYNVEEYVGQCLDSLAAQTLNDLEVILVDDGCTDRTPQIAQTYVEKYPQRFRLVHKPNGGLSDARNFGMPLATGTYLSFLDSDDFVEPTLYEKLAAKMADGCDVCVSDIEYWYQDPARRWIMKGLSSWPAETIQKRALLSPMFAWNKMYRASLFWEGGYRYPLNTWYEDTPVTSMIFANAGTIGYLDECLIHYRQREGSIMADTDSPRLQEIFGVLQLVRQEFAAAGLSQRYQAELEYLHIEHLRLYGMFRFIRSSRRSALYDASEEVMNRCYPNWKHNCYLKNLSRKNRFFLQHYSKRTAWIFDPIIRR